LAVAAVLVALAVWEGLQWRQGPAAHWSVGLSIAAVVALALVVGRGRQAQQSSAWVSEAGRSVTGWRRTRRLSAAVAVWIVLLVAVVGFDLVSFLHQSHDLPTLSYEIGRLTKWHRGRAVVFAAWLAAGVGLAAARLVPRRRRDPSRRQPP
jgi:hypothetical protein